MTDPLEEGSGARGALPPAVAAALATTAYAVPYLLSRSTTPSRTILASSSGIDGSNGP